MEIAPKNASMVLLVLTEGESVAVALVVLTSDMVDCCGALLRTPVTNSSTT